MIHVVSADNMHRHADALEQMFSQRERQRRGFDKATDEFDDETAVYLINVDGDGRVVESLRLNQVPGAQGWQATRWPDQPSDELVEGFIAFCRKKGLEPAAG